MRLPLPRTAREAERAAHVGLIIGLFGVILGTAAVVWSRSALAYWLAVLVQCAGVAVVWFGYELARLAGRWERLEEEGARCP